MSDHPYASRDSSVHGGMECPQFRKRGVAIGRVVEAGVGLGETLAVVAHEVGAEVVVGASSRFVGRIRGPAAWEGKVSNTSAGVWRRSSVMEEPKIEGPDFVGGATGGGQNAPWVSRAKMTHRWPI